MQTENKHEWRVPAFDLGTESISFKKRKRKRSKSILASKDAKPQLPLKEVTNNIEVRKHSDQLLSSPVLNKRHNLNNNTSPIILQNKKCLIKIKKAKFSAKTKLSCARNLTNNIDDISEEKQIQASHNCHIAQLRENTSEIIKNNRNKCDENAKCEVLSPNIYTTFSQLDENNSKNYFVNISPSPSPNLISTQLSLHIELPHSQSENTEEVCTESLIHTIQHSPTITTSNESINISPLRSQINVCSQPSDKIDLLDSPNKLSQKREYPNIDECSSQDNSVVTISSNSTVDGVEVGRNDPVEFISSKLKRKYKPGSYAYNLQKLILKQKSDVTLWKHELYLALTSNFQLAYTESQSIINLNIIKICNSFDVVLLECTDNSFYEKCLVVPDSNYTRDLNLKKSDKIDIYPTYFVNYLHIFDNKVKVFTNVHKIVKLN